MSGEKALIAMSGGVDSAAAAALLRQAGYVPVGCTLRLFDSDDPASASRQEEDARAVCAHLGIEFVPFRATEAFRRRVLDDFVASYAAGRTPNPCVQCNRYVKFPALLELADRLGIPFIATGHYARTDYDAAARRWRLLRGTDRRKDQSYFLYPLTQEQLSRLKLPVGGMCKPQVRAAARELALPCAQKADSQDICFIPDGDYMAFLRQYGGQERYTTGQRRGLGVSADRPLYVLGKDAASHTVVLGDDCQLYRSTVLVEGFHWVSLPPRTEPLAVAAKTRYSQWEASATLYPEADGRATVVFDQPQRAVTAGQSLVAYIGEAVVGGGVIRGAE